MSAGSLDLSDEWNLSGGVRWTDEDKSTTIAFPYVHSFISGPLGAVPSGFFAGPIDFSDSNFSPEVVLKYSPTGRLQRLCGVQNRLQIGWRGQQHAPNGNGFAA